MQDIDPNAARVLALAALALWGKGMALSAAQVIVRVRSRAVTRPEDARLMRVAPATAEHPLVDTLGAAWRKVCLKVSNVSRVCSGNKLKYSSTLCAFIRH